jgi:ammonium transporter, Amt family
MTFFQTLKIQWIIPILGFLLLSVAPAIAQEISASPPAGSFPAQETMTVQTAVDATPGVKESDTAFIMICAALVLLMTPGLGLFYGGMVRHKNVLSTFQQSFVLMGAMAIQWVLIGYSLAFGSDTLGGFIGGLDYAFLNNVGLDPHPVYGPTIPHQLFMIYQCMFAVITPALISGAFAERIKFSGYLVFSLLWSTLVYSPVAHWVWGGGWIGQMGALDFAGGLVVHLISGVAALVCCIVIGKRNGHGNVEMHPHNLTMTALGTGLLWFGWFGFNAGSALAANKSAVAAFVNTNIAGAAATVGWVALEWLLKGKGTVLGACSGAVAGLVVITPAAGFVAPMSALVMGLMATGFCYLAIMAKNKFGYDDSLDVVGIHGAGGLLGAVLTGVFAQAGITNDVNGLINGNAGQMIPQLISIVAAGGYSLVVTTILALAVHATIGLRVSAEDEEIGLDLSQHGERGYIMGIGEFLGGSVGDQTVVDQPYRTTV